MALDFDNVEPIRALSAASETVHLAKSGREIAVYRTGAGRPVLCLHAAGHASGDFRPLAQRLNGEFEIIAPDWPGQGLSPAAGLLPRAEDYADLIFELLEVLQIDTPILLGNSIGGAAALIAAHRAPDRFAGLVLCNAGGLAKIDPSARFVIRRMEAFFRAGARGARWYDRAFRFYYRRMVLPGAPDRAEEIIRAGRALAPLLAEAWAGFRAPSADLRSLAEDVDLPVWLAWARNDKLVSWGRSKRAARRFRHRKETLFEGGHSAFLEAPDRFTAEFADFAGTL